MFDICWTINGRIKKISPAIIRIIPNRVKDWVVLKILNTQLLTGLRSNEVF